jgi:hypothetical protein
MLHSDFHTFHTCRNRYGRLKPALGGLLPYLHTFHTGFRKTQTHLRLSRYVHACVRIKNIGMEGMEVWKKQAGSGIQPSIPFPHLVEVWNLTGDNHE